MPTIEAEAKTFSREAFYELIWSKPASKLAAELGCSDVMIGKVCKAFDVPKPYPGFWAKLANGKAARKKPLPKNADPTKQTITFSVPHDYVPPAKKAPRELQFDADVREVLMKARDLGAVPVSSKLRSPHPLVTAAKVRIEQLAQQRDVPWSERDHSLRDSDRATISISVRNILVKRALRIMDAFIKRVERLGGEVKLVRDKYDSRRTHTVVTIAGEEVSHIRLREKYKRVRVKNENALYSWDRIRTDMVPTGQLMFDEGSSSYRGPLAIDTERVKLEDKLAAVIERFIREAGDMRLRRRKDEEEKRRREEEERIRRERALELRRRREALEKRQAEEQAKVDLLTRHAESWRTSQVMRDYLDALCDASLGDQVAVPIDSQLAAYLRWGFDQADRLDPLRRSPASVLDETFEEADRESNAGGPGKPR